MTEKSIAHGTASAYFNGCGCPACKAKGASIRSEGTYADYHAGVTKTPPLFLPEDRTTPYDENDSRHGSLSGYTLGCRCHWCKEAGRAYRTYRKLDIPWPKDFNAFTP